MKTTTQMIECAKSDLHNAYIDASSHYRNKFDQGTNTQITKRVMDALTLVNKYGALVASHRCKLHDLILHLPADILTIKGHISENSSAWKIDEEKMLMQPSKDDRLA
tara:strand:+ start:248 stop:568 length:321 start_codon:yes stop_codon:yes gene_type:complete